MLLSIPNLSDGCIYTAENAKRVKFAYDQGHQVASHTWAHRDLTILSRDQRERSSWIPGYFADCPHSQQNNQGSNWIAHADHGKELSNPYEPKCGMQLDVLDHRQILRVSHSLRCRCNHLKD